MIHEHNGKSDLPDLKKEAMLAFHGYLIHVMVFLKKSQMHQTISANRYFHMLVQMIHVGPKSITRLDYRGDLPSGDCSRHPEMAVEG